MTPLAARAVVLALGDDALDALLRRDYLQWIAEAFGASGIGVSGFALFVLFAGAVGLLNWTESFRVPAVWLAITVPLVATTLPAPVQRILTGLVTVAVAVLFLAIWAYWRRT